MISNLLLVLLFSYSHALFEGNDQRSCTEQSGDTNVPLPFTKCDAESGRKKPALFGQEL